MNLLSNLTRRQETALRLNGVWALMVGRTKNPQEFRSGNVLAFGLSNRLEVVTFLKVFGRIAVT